MNEAQKEVATQIATVAAGAAIAIGFTKLVDWAANKLALALAKHAEK